MPFCFVKKIEALKAKERMAVNAKDGTQNFAKVKKGETAQIVAEKLTDVR